MDFSDYIQLNKDTNNVNIKEVHAKTDKVLDKSVEDSIAKYSNMSQSELMNEFIRLNNAKKERGEGYKNSDIENMREILFPYLNTEQKELFENLMNKVK